MFDIETNVSVRNQDTAALIAEKGVRLASGRDVHYVRPSQVARMESMGGGGTLIALFDGSSLLIYQLTIDDVAARLGWTS